MVSKPPPRIEFSWIDYPSDKLTIQAIRTRDPEGWQQELPTFLSAKVWIDRDSLGSLLWLERALAHKAFNNRLGLPDPHPDPDWDRSELIRMLADDYQRYHMTTGIKHTEELVRGIENQAVAQAEKHLGISR
jgi:hypothetical protein